MPTGGAARQTAINMGVDNSQQPLLAGMRQPSSVRSVYDGSVRDTGSSSGEPLQQPHGPTLEAWKQ